MRPVSEYDARIDAKKGLTLRGAKYGHYHVRDYGDGRIALEPRQLVRPLVVARRTLRMMDRSMANLKNGKVSDAVNVSDGADGK